MGKDKANSWSQESPRSGFFEDFADKAGIVFWAANPENFQLIYVSQFASEVLGMPLSAWQRPSFWEDHLFPSDRERVLGLFETAVTSQQTQELEYRLLAADGSLRWFRDKVCVLVRDGTPMLCGMMTDVTSFKTAVGHYVGIPGYTSTFLEIVQLLSERLDIHYRLQALAERVVEVFDVTEVSILDWNSVWGIATQLVHYSVADEPYDFQDEQSVHQLSNLVDGLGWHEQAEPVVTHFNDDALPDWKQNHLQAHNAKTILHVPILLSNEVIGCIEMIDQNDHHQFSASDLELSQAIAQQTAIAITRAQLFEAEARRRREAEILLDVAEFVSSSLDRDEILARVMEILRVYLDDVHNCVISIVSDDGDWLEPVYSWYADAAFALMLKGSKLKINETFTAQLALQGGDPVVVSDLRQIPFANEFTSSKIVAGLRSVLCVPLKIQDRPLGTLHIHYWNEPRQFTAEEIAVLQGVANQTAIAIENARLFANERRQLQLSQTLQQVGALLTASLPLDVVYEQIFALLGQVVQFDSASLFLFDPGTAQYEMVAFKGFEKPVIEKIGRTLSAEGVKKKLAGTPGWAVIDNVLENRHWVVREPLHLIRSWIGALLRVKGETIGLLCVDSLEVGRYSAEDGRTVAAFANQAAVAIENARLAVETARQAKELAILNQVSQETAVSLNKDRFLEKVAQLVSQELFPSFFGFILHDKESNQLRPHKSFYGFKINIEEIVIPMQKSITAKVLQTGEPYYAPNVLQDPYYFCVEERILSELAVPLKVGDEVVGIIDVASFEKDAYSARDINFLTTLASSIAAVLERAKLYDELRVQAASLAGLVAQRTSELKLERDRLFAILESAGEGIILTNIDGHILYANPAMERQSGYARKELIDQNPRMLGSGQVSPSVFKEMWQCLLGQRSWTGEFINRHKGGQIYDVSVTITPISDTQGQVTGYVSVQSDITRLKELERLKTEFIANVSHQLRTPLTNIKTYVSLLNKGRPENFPRYFSVLHYEIDRLARLIQDLLDISRLDAEAAASPDASADFCDVWNIFWPPFVERAERENKVLKLNLANDVRESQPFVHMESYQLEKILSRLVENGLLYTPEGGSVEVTVNWPDNVTDNLQMQVCDNGPGIPRAERPFVFDRFFRGAEAIESGLPGNGLGLAIVRELLTQHGGHISLQSKVGEGSCFTVLLPLARSQAADEAGDVP